MDGGVRRRPATGTKEDGSEACAKNNRGAQNGEPGRSLHSLSQDCRDLLDLRAVPQRVGSARRVERWAVSFAPGVRIFVEITGRTASPSVLHLISMIPSRGNPILPLTAGGCNGRQRCGLMITSRGRSLPSTRRRRRGYGRLRTWHHRMQDRGRPQQCLQALPVFPTGYD